MQSHLEIVSVSVNDIVKTETYESWDSHETPSAEQNNDDNNRTIIIIVSYNQTVRQKRQTQQCGNVVVSD